MKAAVCYQFGEPLRIEEVTLEAPKAGEVMVRVAAVAICHSDISSIHGDFAPHLPLVAGHEAAGLVTEVGQGVTHLAPGQRVVVTLIRSCGHCFYCAQGEPYLCEGDFALKHESRLRDGSGQPLHQGLETGAFAEYVVVDQSQVVPIPDDMPLDRAALLGCGVITGVGAVFNTARPQPGSYVVVIGTGGVGLNTVQAAAIAGANVIIALDTVDAKLEAARGFGATHIINIEREKARKIVRELTHGRGADAVFLTVGSTAAVAQGLQLLRPGGALVMVGLPKWTATADFRLADVIWNGQRMLGSHMGSSRPLVEIPRLAEMYQAGTLKLDELITARYPLEQINEAIAAVERGEALRNVIVLAPELV
ncbi:MAG: Zn-dependent alcohol dehydrogenase [Ktedonobacterales bacterium]